MHKCKLILISLGYSNLMDGRLLQIQMGYLNKSFCLNYSPGFSTKIFIFQRDNKNIYFMLNKYIDKYVNDQWKIVHKNTDLKRNIKIYL